jgi:ornithine cyclodeaminase/alanine dehydrogenase-like protein (mu-crystallin family)
MLVLSETALRSLYESADAMPSAMQAIEEAHREMVAGRVTVPPRLHMDYPPGVGRDRFIRVLTAMVPSAGAAIVRSYGSARTYAGPKPKEGQVVLLYDFESMGLLATLSFDACQVLRTAAPSAIAARALSRADSKRAAVLGSGKHARGQLLGLCAVRPIEEVRVFSPNAEHRQAFAVEMTEVLGRPVHAAASGEDAVEGADIICVATQTRTPVLHGAWLRPGMHVNSIASYELDEEAVSRFDRIVVSSREQVLHDAPPREPYTTMVRQGSLREEDLACELSDLVMGDPSAGRQSPDEVTLFASAGHALWDAAIAANAYQSARERGIGQEVSLV